MEAVVIIKLFLNPFHTVLLKSVLNAFLNLFFLSQSLLLLKKAFSAALIKSQPEINLLFSPLTLMCFPVMYCSLGVEVG